MTAMLRAVADLPRDQREKLTGLLCRPAPIPDGLEGFGYSLDAVPECTPTWCVEGVFEVHDVVLLAGEEILAAKSWLALDLAIARVLGASWLGFNVTSCRPSRVLVISSEGGAPIVKQRVRRLCIGRGVSPEQVEPYIVVIGDRMPLVPRAERDLARQTAMLRLWSHPNPEEALSLAVAAVAPNIERLVAVQDAPARTWGLIIVDTVRKNMLGDENSSTDAARFTTAADELAREHCPVFAVHHNGKGTDGGRKRSARGSSELTAGPRAVLSIDAAVTPRTVHFECNNHIAPEPVGFELVDTPNNGIKIERRTAVATGVARVEDTEVLGALRASGAPMTLSSIRTAIAHARGNKVGAKANQRGTQAALDRCINAGVVGATPIQRGSQKFDGYVLADDVCESSQPLATGGNE